MEFILLVFILALGINGIIIRWHVKRIRRDVEAMRAVVAPPAPPRPPYPGIPPQPTGQ